jgi:hypothetical protein
VGPIQDHIGTVVHPPVRQTAMTSPRGGAAACLIVALRRRSDEPTDIPVNNGA